MSYGPQSASMENNHSFHAADSDEDVQMTPEGSSKIEKSSAISVPSARMIIAGAQLAQNRKTGGLGLSG